MQNNSLNEDNLSHWTYDRFRGLFNSEWGLRYHEKEPDINLRTLIKGWITNREIIFSITTKQEKIDRSYFKWFYWLLNKDNYATDFYKLKAYFVYTEHGNNLKKVKNNLELILSDNHDERREEFQHSQQPDLDENSTKSNNESTLVKVGIKFLKIILWPIWYAIQKVIAGVSWVLSSKKTSKTDPPQQEEDLFFSVNPDMQPYLSILGLSVHDDKMSWRSIKQAYFIKAKEVHPDKGGSAKDFIALKNALDDLHHKVFEYPQPYPEITEYKTDLYHELLFALITELKDANDRQLAALKKIIQDREKILQDRLRIIQDMDRIIQDSVEFRLNFKRILQLFMQIIQDQQRCALEIKLLKQEQEQEQEQYQVQGQKQEQEEYQEWIILDDETQAECTSVSYLSSTGQPELALSSVHVSSKLTSSPSVFCGLSQMFFQEAEDPDHLAHSHDSSQQVFLNKGTGRK